MSEETPTATAEVEELLGRLQDAHLLLMEAVDGLEPARFEATNDEGDSMKRILERSADDANFYYGRLVAEAVSLPQPPGLETADFASHEEAKASLRLAHRNLWNLLHDLTAEDLERTARLESTGEYTLRQVLETAVAHYRLRSEQLKAIVEGQRKGGPDDPRKRR